MSQAEASQVLGEQRSLQPELAHQRIERGLDQAVVLPVFVVLLTVGNDLFVGPLANDATDDVVQGRQIFLRSREVVDAPHPKAPLYRQVDP